MSEKLLYTVGYEGADLSDFLNTLKAHQIKQIIDVRDLPLSRKKGFSKNALTAALARIGITYLHLKALGDPKPGREAARSGDFASFRRIYSHHLNGSDAKASLVDCAVAARKTTSSLLCYERNHVDCHRSMIAEKLKVDFKVSHIAVPIFAGKRRKKAHDTAAAFALG